MEVQVKLESSVTGSDSDPETSTSFFLDVSGNLEPGETDPDTSKSTAGAATEAEDTEVSSSSTTTTNNTTNEIPAINDSGPPNQILYDSVHEHPILGHIEDPDKDSITKSKSGASNCCFNCYEFGHSVRDCKEPLNFSRIRQSRQSFTRVQNHRYHIIPNTDNGTCCSTTFIPGIISQELRQALGLQKYELPIHIYRMRVCGYPPGWKAKLFQDQLNDGLKIVDDGLMQSSGSKKKSITLESMISYPGFTDPIPDGFIDEFWRFNVPPCDPNFKERLMQKFRWEAYLLKSESETEEEAQKRWSPPAGTKRKNSGDPDHSDEIENSSSKRVCIRSPNLVESLSIPKVVMLKDLDFKQTTDNKLFDGLYRNSVTELPDLDKFNSGMEPLLLVPESSKESGHFKKILETLAKDKAMKPKEEVGGAYERS